MAFSFAKRGGVTMAGAFEIVMQERKTLRRKPDETDGGRNGAGIPGSQMGNG